MILAGVASGIKSFDAFAFVKKFSGTLKVATECSRERVLTVCRCKEGGEHGVHDVDL